MGKHEVFNSPIKEVQFLKRQFTFGDAMWQRLDYIEKFLTPPTEQEVCEALSEYSNKKVYYESGKFEVGKYEPSICYLQEDNIVWFNWFKLPPHIVELIGRFYGGLK
jgi:hypothetical protein